MKYSKEDVLELMDLALEVYEAQPTSCSIAESRRKAAAAVEERVAQKDRAPLERALVYFFGDRIVVLQQSGAYLGTNVAERASDVYRVAELSACGRRGFWAWEGRAEDLTDDEGNIATAGYAVRARLVGGWRPLTPEERALVFAGGELGW